MKDALLDLRNLKVIFPNERGIVKAVEGIDVSIGHGEAVALVGESGCGKSVTARAIMRLLSSPPALIDVDAIRLDGTDISTWSENKMQSVRGKQISMIFQDAMTALNPVMTVGKQIDEIYLKHNNITKKEARRRTVKAMDMVGIPEARSRAKSFPHQLSGGLRQRVLIAMAFACMPKLIIADEPTTALDVTIQAQVLHVLSQMQKTHHVSLLLITHDLSVVAHTADTVYVMYSGKIVEKGKTKDLFDNPHHPYTEGLLGSIPRLSDTSKHFRQIPDTVPHPMHKPDGCYFHPRCKYATDACKKAMPPLRAIDGDRLIRCYHPIQLKEGK